jgi:hypothetical protein
MLWQASLGLDGTDEELIRQFVAQVDGSYADIVDALEQPDADLVVLSKRYQQTRRQDYFQSPLGERVRAALLAAGGRADGREGADR